LKIDSWCRSARTCRREKVRNEIIGENVHKNTIYDDIWAKQLVWYRHLQGMSEEGLPKKNYILYLMEEGKAGDQKQHGKKTYSEQWKNVVYEIEPGRTVFFGN
jgi:hypothetical protein